MKNDLLCKQDLRLAFTSDEEQLTWLKAFEKSGAVTGQTEEVRGIGEGQRGGAVQRSAFVRSYYWLPNSPKYVSGTSRDAK